MDNRDYAVVIENLSKTYGELKAVNDISFRVARGSLFAFLGVNGAGKSTTINIICSILRKDGGKVYVNGFDLDGESEKIRNEIGIVFQTSVLDMGLTVKQNLEIRAAFYSMGKAEKKETVDSIVRLLELEPILNRPVKNLSGGQMRRVDIARAMVHRPKLLILDEPTTGLDPKTRLTVWSLIDKIRLETGMTVSDDALSRRSGKGDGRRDHGPRQHYRARDAERAEKRLRGRQYRLLPRAGRKAGRRAESGQTEIYLRRRTRGV